MQVMINSLNNMPLSENKVSGSSGISVLMANSLMFQRAPQPVAGYDDPQLSNFYGQALPFLKRGVPVHLLHIENVAYPETWKNTKVLLMTYSNMKPLDKEVHKHIADWVNNGGVLVYSTRDTDPFQSVQEWWNQGDEKYKAPSQHLFSLMGIDKKAKEGEYTYGKGTVCVVRQDPKEFVLKENADKDYVALVKRMFEEKANAGNLQFKNSFYLERGYYDLVSVLDEGMISNEPYVVKGRLIDLFDPELPVLSEKVVKPGEQAYLVNIDRVEDQSKPQVLCGAARVYDEKAGRNTYSFVAKSPISTTNVMRVLLPQKPEKITISGATGKEAANVAHNWDETSKTCFLTFDNDPEGVVVSIDW